MIYTMTLNMFKVFRVYIENGPDQWAVKKSAWKAPVMGMFPAGELALEYAEFLNKKAAKAEGRNRP